jgi:hypothetical protein
MEVNPTHCAYGSSHTRNPRTKDRRLNMRKFLLAATVLARLIHEHSRDSLADVV